MVIDPTGTHAWVTNSYDDTVSVIDIPTQSVMATIPVGMGPNGISYSPRPPAPQRRRHRTEHSCAARDQRRRPAATVKTTDTAERQSVFQPRALPGCASDKLSIPHGC